MRAEESKYWDHVAKVVKGGNVDGIKDNIWKRSYIVSKILNHRPIKARVLEIGVGQGLAAATVNLLTLGNISYTGTDVSPEFCSFVNRRWGLKAVNTDILKLPDGPFDMVWAFDTLEHVRPEEREAGYKEIDRVLDKHGVILLNVPREDSEHEEEFDWGQDDNDILNLARITKTKVSKWERYTLEEVDRSYLWVELVR